MRRPPQLVGNVERAVERFYASVRLTSPEQQKLLHAFYNGNVAEEVLAAEQQRIDAERAEARRWATAVTHDAVEIKEALDEALKLLTDPHIRYREADQEARRLLNQALFEKLYIRDEDVAEAKPSPWVTDLHRAARTPLACPDQATSCQEGRRNGHDRLSAAVGLNKAKMVPRAGLEPAPPD